MPAPDSDGNHKGQIIWELEGRIASSHYSGVLDTFGIGKRFVFVAQYDGMLQMAMNDWFRSDNVGSMHVTVQRIGTAPDTASDADQ